MLSKWDLLIGFLLHANETQRFVITLKGTDIYGTYSDTLNMLVVKDVTLLNDTASTAKDKQR
jgi:hypothetical protein